jgi:hypothetical protein
MNTRLVVFIIGLVVAVIILVIVIKTRTTTTTAKPSGTSGTSGATKPSKRPYDTRSCYVKPPGAIGGDRSLPMLRVVRGLDAGDRYPFIGAIKYRNILLCGATLVAPLWMIGAAHCIAYLSDMTVTVGRNDLDNVNGPGEIRNIVEFHAHPRFNSSTFEADLALFKLDIAIDNIKPICLPVGDAGDSFDRYLVAGWGSTETEPSTSRMMHATVYPAEGCATVGDSLCAVNNILLSGPCSGDSGGPLFHLNELDQYVLDGVVSRGAPKCVSQPTTFTRVANYIDWIVDTIQT